MLQYKMYFLITSNYKLLLLYRKLYYLSMAPRKDHAKPRISDLPYVTNSLNILLNDVF
jgi:hypothetical protein